MPYVEVKLDEFDDDDLIDELEDRGYEVDSMRNDAQLTEVEISDILEKYSWCVPGTLGYEIYEKLRKR